MTAGIQTSQSASQTLESSTLNPIAESWIASQRDVLAKILAQRAGALDCQALEADLSGRFSEQSTKSSQALCSSKTRPTSARKAEKKSQPLLWREDIAGETEKLVRLMLVRPTLERDGFALLPTLTVCGNYNQAGMSKNSGDGICTALRKLPTLCAANHKQAADNRSGPGRKNGVTLPAALKMLPTLSEEGFLNQTQKRSKPLRDTLPHTTGYKLTPTFAELYMGFPINHTAINRTE